MPEIVITDPIINCLPNRRWLHNEPETKRAHISFMRKKGIVAQRFPEVVDLGAGDGSAAEMLVERGWRPEDITCIDRHKSRDPLVTQARWLYWNLRALGQILLEGQPIPPDVASFQSRFDLAILINGFFGEEHERAVCEYLVKPEGAIVAFSDLITVIGAYKPKSLKMKSQLS